MAKSSSFNVLDDADKTVSVSLPGILKASKTTINDNSRRTSRQENERQTFIGFSSSNLKLDVNSVGSASRNGSRLKDSVVSSQETSKPVMDDDTLSEASEDEGSMNAGNSHNKLKQVNISATVQFSQPTTAKKHKSEADATLDELRNYIMLMDKFSLHNFMIYDGRTLKDTPEFQSFKRTYQQKWGAISSLIRQLEAFLFAHEIKLAIINGPKLFEISKLDPPLLTKEEVYSLIANIDQISNNMDTTAEQKKKNIVKAVIRIQCFLRKTMAKMHVSKLNLAMRCVIRLQSMVRLWINRARLRLNLKTDVSKSDARWNSNIRKLQDWWQLAEEEPTSDNRKRTLIFIPSITTSEYIRLDFDYFRAVQNSHIANLHLLADPDVTLIYIIPFQLSNYESTYHEKLLSLFGISILPRRLIFITPELIDRLPPHLSLAQVLWCSPSALNRIKTFIKKSKSSQIIPTTLGWVEKRLSNYLNIPLLSADPFIVETITARSFSKRIFMGNSMNIPIGAHDIYSGEDLFIALSRLIASNLGVGRWIIRLNYDWNNESVAYIDVERIPLVLQLRQEQAELMRGNNGMEAWYSRQIQLGVRKRLLTALKNAINSKIRICRKDIYANFDYYCRWIRQYGCTIESEPIEKLGQVEALCFIDPLGNITSCRGVEVLFDSNYQTQGYVYPQTITPNQALDGASRMLCGYLFSKYKIMGCVTIKFISLWDAYEAKPRLWASGIQCGRTAIYGALSIAALATQEKKVPIPLSGLPEVPEGNNIYISY